MLQDCAPCGWSADQALNRGWPRQGGAARDRQNATGHFWVEGASHSAMRREPHSLPTSLACSGVKSMGRPQVTLRMASADASRTMLDAFGPAAGRSGRTRDDRFTVDRQTGALGPGKWSNAQRNGAKKPWPSPRHALPSTGPTAAGESPRRIMGLSIAVACGHHVNGLHFLGAPRPPTRCR